MDAVSFEGDIRPLFRQRDVDSMARFFDLSSYDAVKSHADRILGRLSQGSMPCDGAWPADRVALFQRWIDGGYAR